jgi:hypothetical protein
MAHPFTDDLIDWPALEAAPGVIRGPGLDALDRLRGRQIYVATPVSQYLARGEAEIALQLASEAAAYLMSLGLSPVAPAVLTLAAVLARGDDLVGLQLQAMDHDWWMRRCLPWIEASAACVVPPLRGWDTSQGVWREASLFALRQRPVLLLGGVWP